MQSLFGRTLTLSLLALAPAIAQAGPPLVCFPIPIGEARSLAWGSGHGWDGQRADYDRSRLAEDTVALLRPQAPVLVRMETLRRAAIYASGDAAAAKALFAALRARPNTDPLAQFDLGYAVETYRQTRPFSGHVRAIEPPEDGYALVRQALAARGSDPEMQYAAALMTCDRSHRAVSEEHLRLAVAGARQGSDLARVLEAHEALWGGRVQALRAATN
jgi:hypothetical protein